MSDEPIAPYVSEGIDAGLELLSLGLDAGRRTLLHMQAVVARTRKYEEDQTFHTFEDLGVYKAEFGDCFILFIVEEESDGCLRVTLMLAGRISEFSGTGVWNAAGLERAKRMVTERLEDFFDDEP
jgi:hypothetical protein